MIRPYILLLAFIFSPMLAACSSTSPETGGTGGSAPDRGGASGGGNPGGAGGGGGTAGFPDGRGTGGQHLELCGVIVTCQDGVLGGMYGNSCSPLFGTCALGCRVASAGTSDQSALMNPNAFAQTLCNSPDASAPDANLDSDSDGRGD